MSKNNQTLEVISINQIDVSKTNPRKHFDENALKELSQSIKEHGILQPVLVRPMNDKEEGFEQFELVCGERRYRAAIIAGLEDIPVNIRVLTDDEAFELQIVENLERKDVHPLDEADAFKKMLDSGKYTIADIAAKMAKSESFIAQRLKLVDLIDDVRTDFIAGHLGIGHAILIARCDEFKQLDIYKEAQPYREGVPEYGTISELKETIEDDSYLLTEAKFDTTDDKLLSDTCACTVCPKRSGANPVLFEDMAEDRCFDKICFDKKDEAFLEKEVAKIITEGQNIILVAGWNKPSKMILDICSNFGINIYQQYTWADHLQKDKDGNEFDCVKAFGVSGHKEGIYFDAWIKPQDENSVNNLPATSGAIQTDEEKELRAEFEKIEARQKRALELDDEKIWTSIRAIETTEVKNNVNELSQIERNALCYAMIDKLGYYGITEVRKQIKDFNAEFAKTENFTDSHFNQISRIFIVYALPSAYGTHVNQTQNIFYTKFIQEHSDSSVASILADQKAIAEKRIMSVNSKIEVLKTKIEALKPIEEPKKQAPERTEDEVEIKRFVNDVKEFDRVDKKYALNNSYFKNRKNTYPANPLEVAMYHEQFGTLPFEYSGTDWLYDTYIEYQKRNNVYHSQFFTPPATAQKIASLADRHFIDPKGEANGRPWVMDMCCGFGMLSKPIREKGFIVRGFDFSQEMVDLYNFSQDCIAERCDYENDAVELYDWVVANPPYEVPKLTKFFERLHSDILADNGKAIILLPKGFMMKEKPKSLVEILEKFNIIHSEDMTEDFAHTKIKAEIVVLEKA